MQQIINLAKFIWTTRLLIVSLCTSVHAGVDLSLHSKGDAYMLKVSGEIRENTLDDFKKVIDEVKSTNKKLHLNMVHFDSIGGSGTVAVEISRIIRSEGLNTFVASDDICHSACTYAFIGGVQRYAFGKFGVHNTTFTDGTEVKRKYVPRIVNNNIQFVIDFVREMRLSSNLANAILDTPSWTLRVLSNEEKFAWGINGTDRAETDFLLLQIAKERGMKSGDFARVVDQYYRDCHQRTERLQETVWDCLRKREEEVPLWKRVRKWIREMLAG